MIWSLSWFQTLANNLSPVKVYINTRDLVIKNIILPIYQHLSTGKHFTASSVYKVQITNLAKFSINLLKNVFI